MWNVLICYFDIGIQRKGQHWLVLYIKMMVLFWACMETSHHPKQNNSVCMQGNNITLSSKYEPKVITDIQVWTDDFLVYAFLGPWQAEKQRWLFDIGPPFFF